MPSVTMFAFAGGLIAGVVFMAIFGGAITRAHARVMAFWRAVKAVAAAEVVASKAAAPKAAAPKAAAPKAAAPKAAAPAPEPELEPEPEPDLEPAPANGRFRPYV